VLCYVGGFFRLYGTFECFSNLLPKVTPTFNYGVFLSFVFFIVLACVQVIDWVAIHIIYYYRLDLTCTLRPSASAWLWCWW